MAGAGALAFSSLILAACGGAIAPDSTGAAPDTPAVGETPAATKPIEPAALLETDELGDPLTEFEAVTGYNNFYEFTTDKKKVALMAQDFKSTPWVVEVGGLVHNPRTFGLEDLYKFDQEDRVYRLRCVEGWSMVIPWLGFPLAKLLNQVEPMSTAKYVHFRSIFDPSQMHGQKDSWYSWPYAEGLRLDEAMHDLTILSTGLYGKQLLPQNGRRCGWWCPGSTASRASSRLSKSI